MKPLICPQCGGSIANYSEHERFATCVYCSTRFLIESAASPDDEKPPVIFQPPEPGNSQSIFLAVGVSVLIAGALILFALVRSSDKPEPKGLSYSRTGQPTQLPTIAPTAKPELDLLRFGGEGTGDGLFDDASSIAIDSDGRIYVSDDTLRVQQFDPAGNFIKLWQVPSKTSFYKRALQINKISVSNDNRLYVAVGGVILVYSQDDSEPSRTIHAAPDYVQDFALKSDGRLLMISNNEQIETLHFVDRAGKITRRIPGFHTNTAEPTMSPASTGVVAIRVAVDGAGNIFSVYALGDIGSYQLNHNSEEFLIYRFTSDGKYVNKFVQTMDSCGIAVDNQSRIYISDHGSISVYTDRGELVSTIGDLNQINAFALDKSNNVYAVLGNVVVKRPAI